MARVTTGRAVATCVGLGFTAALLVGGPLLQVAGEFLGPRDPLVRSDTVIAISGNNPERVATAVRLWRQGYATWVILSGPPRAVEEMTAMARESGVPTSRLLADSGPTSTLENALGSAAQMQRQGLRTAILVTSPYHMRRAIVLFRQVFREEGLEVRAFPAEPSMFQVNGWWRRPGDRRFVLVEYAKLFAALIGIR